MKKVANIIFAWLLFANNWQKLVIFVIIYNYIRTYQNILRRIHRQFYKSQRFPRKERCYNHNFRDHCNHCIS